MTRIVLLRHGRTSWNAEGRYQGQEDVTLDDTGRVQAAAVAAVIAAMAPKHLWSSDLARAAETTAYVAAATGLGVVFDKRLRERNCGAFSSLTAAEIRAQHPEVCEEFFAGGGPLGAESEVDVASRVTTTLGEYADLIGPHGTGVVVSHGWAIRMAVTELIQARAAAVRGLENCGWAELTRDRDRWHLLAWNRVVS